MGQQIKRVLKRRRRKAYLTRKSEQAKLGLKPKKSSAIKIAAGDDAAAKKAPAKKAAVKKAPAKKVAKVVEAAEESAEA